MDCIFCGSSLRSGKDGNSAEEHSFPKWLQNRIGARHRTIANVTEDLISGSRREMNHTLERFVAKRVCKDCNCGWMNDLEKAVRRILEPVFLGESSVHNLPLEERSILQRWAMKTALAVIASSPAKSMAAPVGHHRLLVNDDPLPDGLHVFATHVGGSSGRFGLYMIGRYSLLEGNDLSPKGEEMADSYTVVIHFGYTVLVVMFLSAPQHALLLNERRHFPLARNLDLYGWYERLPPSPQEFDDERDLWDRFISDVLVLRVLPEVGTMFDSQDALYTIVKPPAGISAPPPTPQPPNQ